MLLAVTDISTTWIEVIVRVTVKLVVRLYSVSQGRS